MKNIIKSQVIAFMFVALVGFSLQATAQSKIGYVNVVEIMTTLPAYKQASTKWETLGKQKQKAGEDMLKRYQTRRKKIEEEVAGGIHSPKKQETLVAELQKEEEKILKYEQEMKKDLAEKENELLKPIKDKVQQAIKDVAKDNGYTYIIDASSGVLLYADEATNIASLVKQKLGM